MRAADEADHTHRARMDVLEKQIARTRATTLEGVLVKARMAARDPITGEGVEGDLEQALRNPQSTSQFIGMSVILDILHINGATHDSCAISQVALLCRKLDPAGHRHPRRHRWGCGPGGERLGRSA